MGDRAVQMGQSTYNWGASRLKEAGNVVNSWTKSMENTVKHFCTSAQRIKKAAVAFVKDIDWKKVAVIAAATIAAIVATVATAGIAGPAIAAALGTGLAGTVETGAALGAAGGGAYNLTQSALSGNDAKTVAADTLKGAVAGGITGGATAGLAYGAQSLLNNALSGATKSAASAADDVAGSVADDLAGGAKPQAACFTAGTLIPTDEGYKEIQKIQAGDRVLSENPETGYREVRRTFLNESRELIHVYAGEEQIKATPVHPFWVEGKGFVPAGELETGDVLRLSDGSSQTVTQLTKETFDEPVGEQVRMFER